jgi:hypothetical protein
MKETERVITQDSRPCHHDRYLVDETYLMVMSIPPVKSKSHLPWSTPVCNSGALSTKPEV